MNRLSRQGLRVLICLLLLQGVLHAQQARIAVISEGAETRNVADLLTARFSLSKELILLERSEIDRIYQEQSIAGAEKNLLKAGQLLGAEGLLVISPAQSGEGKFFDIRLAAVNQGVVLRSSRQSTPGPAEQNEWMDMIWRQFSPFLTKLSVRPKDVVPVSILNFRSPSKDPVSVQFENTMTALLISRLSEENNIFVLERRGLLGLQREKDFLQDEDAFWNGRYLLEGTLDAQGFRPDTVHVSVRLRPPEGADPIVIEVSGPRSKTGEVVETLSRKVMEALNKPVSGSGWRADDEANQYFLEARWSSRWGLVEDSQIAAETAWALGGRSLDLATFRIRSYFPDIRLADYEVTRAAPVIRFLRPPDPRRLEPTRHALEVYLDYARNIPVAQISTNKALLTAGAELVDAAASRIGYYHEWYRRVPDVRAKYDERLADLRRMVRGVAASVDTMANFPDLEGGWAFTKARYVKHWCEQPEDAFPHYTSLLVSSKISAIRVGLMGGTNLLTAWHAEDEARLPKVWKSFVERWQSSTNQRVLFEARALRLHESMPSNPEGWPEWNQHYKAFMDYVLKQHEENILLNYDPLAMHEAVDSLYFWAQRHPASVASRQEMGLLHDEFNRVVSERKPIYQFKHLRDFVVSSNTYDSDFFETYSRINYSLEQAREMLPLLEQYQKRIGRNGFKVVALMNGLKNVIASHEKSPPATVSVVPADSLSTPTPPIQKMAKTFTKDQPVPQATATGANDRTLRVTRAWRPNFALLGLDDSIPPNDIVSVRYREGRLWVLCKFSGYGAEGSIPKSIRFPDGTRASQMTLVPQAALFSIDPSTFETEALLLPGAAGLYHQTQMQHGFDVTKRHIYVSASGALACYDRERKVWKTISLPITEDATVFATGSKVLLGGVDTILTLDPGSGETEVLASSRRRPATTTLDNLSAYRQPSLFADETGDIRALIQGKCYFYDSAKRDWRQTSSDPGTWNLVQLGEKGLFIRRTYPMQALNMLYLAGPLPSPMPLYLPGANASSITRWSWWLPPTPPVVNAPSTLKGESLAVWQLQQNGESTDHLWLFDDRWDKPFEVPLVFSPARKLTEYDQSVALSYARIIDVGTGYAFIIMSPTAKQMAGKGDSTIWILSENQLQSYLSKQMAGAGPSRREFVVRQKYDLNRDGWLMPDEVAKMRADPEYQADEAAELKTILDQRITRLMEHYDFDGNKTFDQLEIGVWQIYAKPYDMGFAPTELMRFDLNRNGVIEADEAQTIMQQAVQTNNRIGVPPRFTPALGRTTAGPARFPGVQFPGAGPKP